MAMTGFFPLLWWSLAGACAVGGSVYLFIEYQAYLLRTSVSSVPGGLRFQSHRFSVESRTSAKQLVVQTKGGHYVCQPLTGGDEQVQTGAQTVTFDAVGLRMEVFRTLGAVEGEEKPKETGFSTVYFKTSDELTQQARGHAASERSELRLDHVPDPIAREFAGFANGMHDWIAKVERRLAADVQEKRQHIKENWTLPEWLAKKNLKAQIRVRIDDKGRIISKQLVKSSGNPAYDDIVKATIEKSEPFPVPPEKFSAVVSVNGILIGFPE